MIERIKPLRLQRSTSTVTMRRALSDDGLLASTLEGDSWRAWRTVLIAAMGERLTDGERALFKQLTGRDREPGQRVLELVACAGRRGGKSRATATLAAFLGGLVDYRHVLAPGETGVLLIIAPDQRQASVCLNYTNAAFVQSPIMRQLIASRTADTLTLKNGISIEVRAASFRRLRGPTYIAIIADEAAYWPSGDDGAANPDVAILNAVRPGLATTRGPLIIISSPYARRGELWNAYHRHYGPEGDPRILVVKGASRTLNPTLPQSVIDRAMDRDPAAAAAEYLAEFRSDLEEFVSRDAVLACLSDHTRERAPERNITYRAFVDPSGGSADSFTLAIGHRLDDDAVLDAIRERRPPFSPSDVVREFSDFLKSYRVTAVAGDRYAGEWPREAFRKCGIRYELAPKPKSDLYVSLLPLLNSGKIALLSHDRLIAQLTGLERRTARSGKDSIDHAPGAHDDIANAVAGVASMLGKPSYDVSGAWMSNPTDAAAAERLFRGARLRQHIFNWR
ncbi:MAG: hypothetical protein AB7O60_03650 [Variibacter sp.]